jgi:5'-methylthioadenosine nucleosidase
MNEHGAAVKEMEAGAIAWVVTQLFKKPMFCSKAITDIVDGGRPTNEEFLENLHAAAAALQGMLPRVLEFVAGKTVEEL